MSYRKAARAYLGRIAAAILSWNVDDQAYSREESGQTEKRSKHAPAKRFADYQHASEDEHRTAEQKSWVWSKWTNVTVLIVASLAALFAGFTWWQTRRQANAAVEGNFENNRAWVRVDGFAHWNLSVLQSGAIFNADMNVWNVGHSPAESVHAAAKLISDRDPADLVSEAISRCRPGVRNEAPQFEPMVFPDQPETASVDAKIADRTIMSLPGPHPWLSSFVIVGCVTYYMPTSRAFGHTTFVYNLDRRCGPGLTVAACTFDLSKPAFYPEADVLLTRFLGGERAD